MILDWHREALAEFGEAAHYYDEQVDDLGDRFAGQIEASAARIRINPLMPRCFYRECRKVKADKFPYLVIYRVKNDVVQILAVMHTSRHPDYWKSRLKNG
jgi:toxin ParE1/3/4